ncbi:hypothetical protein KTG68_13900 [Acinetobacter variabilis]|jgi:hypothetical protein|uniref:hypothetical protein n=1 Tax=Acinetobacter variabilis TaxID=70346 RepID=UPI0021D1A924|nr:hypothetical protein [Acinetobacter variabilis]MCU4313056.1 hypothetical protein [Acinetobacter variabilis]
MKKDLSSSIHGLINYLGLNSIEELRSLSINNDLIENVGNYLLHSKEKITTSKVADLLGLNRASIYNTYPNSATYLRALIAQQKASNSQNHSTKSVSSVKKPSKQSPKFSDLNKEQIEKFFSIIMSLEFQNKKKDKQINELRSQVASLKSEIREYKKMLGDY